MSDFVILSDSSCDLTRDLRERFDVADYLPGILYYPDGSEHYSDLDWADITPDKFFGMMKDKKAFFKTAAVSSEMALEMFEKHLKMGMDILMLTLSSALSGTFSICKKAAEDLMKKYPNRKVIVIDSLRYSTALSVQLVKASELRASGKSLEETAKWISDNRCRVHQMGPLDDLFFCKKMGRVSGTAAFMGTMVGIRPLADFNDKGMSNVIGKTKGARGAAEATVEYMKKTIENPEDQIIFIAHSLREKQAMELKKMVEDAVHPKDIIVNTIGQACGPNIGPGLVAVYYYGKKISVDNVEEKALLAGILGKK